MPRPKNETSALLADLQSRVAQLVETARRQGRDEALGHIRSLVGGAAPKRGPGRPRKDAGAAPAAPARTKSGKRRKNPWAKLSPAARLARINAIRKGKGLPLRNSL
jgi:hypothetical protein